LAKRPLPRFGVGSGADPIAADTAGLGLTEAALQRLVVINPNAEVEREAGFARNFTNR